MKYISLYGLVWIESLVDWESTCGGHILKRGRGEHGHHDWIHGGYLQYCHLLGFQIRLIKIRDPKTKLARQSAVAMQVIFI